MLYSSLTSNFLGLSWCEKSVCVCVCVWRKKSSGRSCQGKSRRLHACLLPPQIFLCLCLPSLSMADLLLLMLAKYSWMRTWWEWPDLDWIEKHYTSSRGFPLSYDNRQHASDRACPLVRWWMQMGLLSRLRTASFIHAHLYFPSSFAPPPLPICMWGRQQTLPGFAKKKQSKKNGRSNGFPHWIGPLCGHPSQWYNISLS